jgi:hypothetical protein
MIINKAAVVAVAVVAAASQLGIQSIEESKSGTGVSDSFVGGGALNDGKITWLTQIRSIVSVYLMVRK